MAWQDWLVTGVAALAAVIVFWKTIGSWKDSKPGGAGAPHCDGCALQTIGDDGNDRNDRNGGDDRNGRNVPSGNARNA